MKELTLKEYLEVQPNFECKEFLYSLFGEDMKPLNKFKKKNYTKKKSKFQSPKRLKVGMISVTPKSNNFLAPSFDGNYAFATCSDLSTGRTHEGKNLFLDSQEYYKKHPTNEIGQAILNKPIEIHISGLDDSSYSKWFSTIEEAIEFWNLITENQPVDIKELIKMGFVFTN